jgi:hypothetical protein
MNPCGGLALPKKSAQIWRKFLHPLAARASDVAHRFACHAQETVAPHHADARSDLRSAASLESVNRPEANLNLLDSKFSAQGLGV